MMEFEDEERDEEEEEEDEEDDNNNNNDNDEDEDDDEETLRLLSPSFKKQSSSFLSRYRECLKNHAVSIGGHALDGCGEFMPAGPDGSLDALKCAACNCHRNFHRKELLPTASPSNHHHHHQLTVYTPRPPPHLPPPPPPHVFQFYPYNRTTAVPTPTTTTPPTRPLALPSPTAAAAAAAAAAASGDASEDHLTGGMMTMTMTSSSGKKRHRTKFTQEQKDRMLGLAERLGWRIQKQDETVVQQFCDETGVERHVLKVWMHNNKHTLGKKPDSISSVIPGFTTATTPP